MRIADSATPRVDGVPIEDLVSSERAAGVLTVTLRRPEKRNALSRPLIAALGESFSRWRDDADIRVAVLTGEGDKAFASGGDVKELDAVRNAAETLEFAQTTRAALDTIRRFPVPVIAAVNGDALGGGAELALACDMRFAAPHARIGFLQGRLNIATAWGGGTDLLRLLGSARALNLLCTTALLDAPGALKAGLIDAVAPDGESFDAALAAFVATLSARPPQVMRAFKALTIAHRAGAGTAEMAAIENREFTQTWIHRDHWDAVETVFNRRG
jgi:enoyl-CoA hydratase